MYKIAKILAIILGIVGLVLWVVIANSNDNEGMISLMINVGKWMTIITAVVTVLFAIVQLLSHPDKLKKSLISIVAFGLVLLISYFVLSSGTDVDLQAMADKGIDVTEGTSKTVGAGLWAFYLLAIIAILAMVVSGVKKILTR
ncbi:hypothetical protein OOZ15_02325 [Galbibacter sp. EGI 63066]|uniref:hypothetical protein n=1 Tax=Galbibacter sp. EGI 63066 TaxID=2993559 RepID=UPI00224921FE|nr:hypothetical protein [Galbibacter sp. EGI 63066]MCX2678766.1 hypothetical protein [Galbibacter sp. EGI 63066]